MQVLTIILVAIFICEKTETTIIQSCDSLIYCQGELLEVVQKARIFNDSKTFVDLSQKNDANETLERFNSFMESYNNSPTREEVGDFVKENFGSIVELEKWTPSDYITNPKFLKKIEDITVRDFARNLIRIWPNLARKVKSIVSEHPDRHSLISLPNGFIIPGGRFTEIYYWDSYWIVEGLIISEMTETVRGILENFLSLVERYGFVPNGSRVYYLNRSQPPLLSSMVRLYIDATNDLDWLRKHINTLEKELKWWCDNRTIKIKKNGKYHQLARYASESGTPRPESYFEDLITCSTYSGADKENCYKNLKSAAESGWDFSARWFFTEDGGIGTNISLIDTRRIIPVDLNAFLCKAFGELSTFHKLLENEEKSSEYQNLHESWRKSIEVILYDEVDGIWYDFDIKLSKPRKGFFPSNLAPLWAIAYNISEKDQHGSMAVKYLKDKQIDLYMGGTPTSLVPSGEQWDFPNAWPPLQEIVILGLRKTGNSEALKLSTIFGKRCLNAYIRGYSNTNEMFEKYDAVVPGQYGGGGEYTVQTGFGWTNGLALSLIKMFHMKDG